MTRHIALLGAGFSRNWNGPLAAEVYDALLSDPGIQADPALRELVLTYRRGGQFELALYELQLQAATNSEAQVRLRVFQSAILAIFRRVNQAFIEMTEFDIGRFVGSRVTDFLIGFDAIFSLNQDILLERHHISVGNVALAAGDRWSGGACLPGVRAAGLPYFDHAGWLDRKWTVTPPFEVPRRSQPVFNLHGAANWIDQGGANLLIIGGGKEEAIRANPLLSWNLDQFRAALTSPDTRLMIIGYGFQDAHVNNLLEEGIAAGLKLFIVDPVGVELIDRAQGLAAPETMLQSVQGVSRRALRTTFGEDQAEREKLMGFFAS